MTWTGKTWKFNTTPDDADMTALQADITAKANGDTGAPQNQVASFSSLVATETTLGASAVAQGKLQTATGEVSGSPADASIDDTVTLPGGEYGFYPQIKHGSGTYTTTVVIAGRELDPPSNNTGDIISSTYGTMLSFRYSSGTAGIQYAQQRYVQSSPPYDLGDGPCHLFMFCRLDANGEVRGSYVAPEAPWHNNGPTDTRKDRVEYVLQGEGFDYRAVRQMFIEALYRLRTGAELDGRLLAAYAEWLRIVPSLERVAVYGEVPQKLKNADMALIPHPFGTVRDGETVVLLDPLSETSAQLMDLQRAGEKIAPLLHNGLFKISNSELSRVSPPGVRTVSYRWH